jgi:hypothetical protein
MPERYDELEAKIEKLTRYLELIESNLKELKEQIDIRHDLDKVENVVLRLAKTFKSRKEK